MGSLLPLAAVIVLGLPVGDAAGDKPPPYGKPGDALEQRAKQVQACVAAEPSWPDDLFDATFVAAVPPEKLREIFRGFFQEHGAMVAMPILSRESPTSAKLEARFAKGTVMAVSLTVAAEPTHAIVGLWFGPPAPALPDLAAVAKEMEALPGQASLLAARIGKDGALEPVAELRADVPLAIGSTFKLYVLGALAADVAAKRRSWGDVVGLDPRYTSLPSGFLQSWPAGAPVTLHTLASLMISQSDNTATDQLIHLLGRRRVEEMLAPMGNDAAAKNQPFLSTAEMFRLKCADGGKLAQAFLAAEGRGPREALLEGAVAKVDLGSLDLGQLARPAHIDRIEWFASTRALGRAMAALRRAGEKSPEVLDILAINPGLDVPRDRFAYAGYKGGSEGGVLNLTFLLRDREEAWYVLSATWNDPAAALDEMRFFGLVTSALRLVGEESAEPR